MMYFWDNRISWDEFFEANNEQELTKIDFEDLERLTTRQTALLLEYTDWTIEKFSIVALTTPVKKPYILQDLLEKAEVAKK